MDKNTDHPAIAVIDVNNDVARRVTDAQKHVAFSEKFPDKTTPEFVVGAGDVLEVSIWEAPPSMLFGMRDPRAGTSSTQNTSFPEQMVPADGSINIPFAGKIVVAGKSPQHIEKDIARKLAGIANQPQVLVRVTHNMTSNVTVVGEVTQSLRLPLTPKGERLLDAIAATGGVKQPVDKMTIQLSRNGQVQAMAMDEIIRDPNQNIMLHAGDVVTAMFQPLSFTALGATGKNEELSFEAKGITLAQALGRIGGVDDTRANAQGVFIFRFEDPSALAEDNKKKAPLTPDGKVPVVYRLNLNDPSSFLVAQNFPVHNKDVLYVANSPITEFQKFMNILYTSIFSAVYVKTL